MHVVLENFRGSRSSTYIPNLDSRADPARLRLPLSTDEIHDTSTTSPPTRTYLLQVAHNNDRCCTAPHLYHSTDMAMYPSIGFGLQAPASAPNLLLAFNLS